MNVGDTLSPMGNLQRNTQESGSPNMSPRVDTELGDALEALKAARDQQKKILRDVRLQKLGSSSRHDDGASMHEEKGMTGDLGDSPQPSTELSVGGFSDVPADGAFKGTQKATGKLRRELDAVKEKLEVGSYEAAENTRRLRGHVSLLKKEVNAMELEVSTLQNAVDNVREGCRITKRENERLAGKLDDVYSERDRLVTGLADLMSNTRNNLKEVEADRTACDTELSRLREQNDYLRLQLIPNRRFPR